MIINGGTGNGYAAKVNSSNMLLVSSVSSTVEHYINHINKRAYNIVIEQSPTANDDCIFYMENTSDDGLIIEGVMLSVDAACSVYLKLNDEGTRNSATDVTPVNLNAGSGNTAEGNFEYGADLDGGSATLTGGTIFEKYVFTAATNSDLRNFEQDVILPKNRTLTMWCSSSAATVNATIIFNYHEEII